MASKDRPLSPHLQIYRLPLTALLSITHRMTGAFLGLGALLLIYLLVSAAAGPQAYGQAHALVASGLGQLLLFLWTYALFFHFCNGIRHLFWDAGYGFELETVEKTAYGVVVASFILTLAVWGVALVMRGNGS